MAEVKITRLDAEVSLPKYQTAGAAGCDLEAFAPGLKKNGIIARIASGERALIGTGIAIELPVGFEAQIRPRSGNAVKHGVTVLNAPGTIDSDYRGEIKVVLFNSSRQEFTVRQGDRIAQMVVSPVVQAVFTETEILTDTERGKNGFGSTGINENTGQNGSASEGAVESGVADGEAAPTPQTVNRRRTTRKVAESPTETIE